MLRLADTENSYDDLPDRRGDPGRLFLWFPVGLALRKVRRFLRQSEREFAISGGDMLVVDAPDGFPQGLVNDLGRLLTVDERGDTRCVFKTGTDDIDVDDIARVRTIEEWREAQASTWFVDLLRDDRLTSVFQPIVHADSPARVLGHEALVRGIGYDGRTVPPGSLLDAARGCGMLPELDCAARRTAIRAAATQESRQQLFLNFTPETMREGVHRLAPTIDAIDAAEIRRERVVFEVIEPERAADVRQLRAVVDSVRDAGFRVALDDIGCAARSRRLVHEVRPDFIKLDMERVRRSPSPHLGDAERLMELAQRLRIETIAEAVETEAELDWNRERGATYVQGYYIARPAALCA